MMWYYALGITIVKIIMWLVVLGIIMYIAVTTALDFINQQKKNGEKEK